MQQEQLEHASRDPLDDVTFAAFAATDWSSVCLAEDGELGSIAQLTTALALQVRDRTSRLHAVVANVVSPFFQGSSKLRTPRLTETERFMFEQLHTFIRDVCRANPRHSDIVSRSLCSRFPFYGTCSPHAYVAYLWNLLTLSPFLPEEEERQLLHCVLDRVYLLDVNTNAEDPEDEENQLKLDHAIDTILAFIEASVASDGEVDGEKVQRLYSFLFPSFVQTICPSAKPLQSMFWMFFLANASRDATQRFCADLWRLFDSGSMDPLRVLGCLTSFCTRSLSVTPALVLDLLTRLAAYCHEYLETCSVDTVSPVKHLKFYAAFQSLVYLIVFRSSDLEDPKILQILKVPVLLDSPLAPLSACPEAVADTFLRIASHLHVCGPSRAGKQQLASHDLQDVWLVLSFHAEPLETSRRRMTHLLRHVADLEGSLSEGGTSVPFDQSWLQADALDYAF